MRIPDIGLVRVYDKDGSTVLSEYRKPDGPAFAILDARRAMTISGQGQPVSYVERVLGVGQSIQAFAPTSVGCCAWSTRRS